MKIDSINQVKKLAEGQVLFQDETNRFVIKTIKGEFLVMQNQKDGTHVKMVHVHNLLNDGWNIEMPSHQMKKRNLV